MNALERLSKVFRSSEEIPIDDSSKVIIMSDCHRGDGGWSDNFTKNQNLYKVALDYYYDNGYTYIEIGDGDELWEIRNFSDIVNAYSEIFLILSKFYKDNRLYFIFGNHDIVKSDSNFVRNNLYQYFDERRNKYIPLFPNIKIHEGLVLDYKPTGDKIFLVHGHQIEIFNSTLWKINMFLVRYLWKLLELYGINNPTRTARNHKLKDDFANKLTEWVMREKQMIIAGHNHMPMFPEVGEPPYFNDGSCIHLSCITGIEIVNGNIMLIRWCTKTKKDGTLFVGKEILAGPRRLKDYFNLRGKYYERGAKADKKQKVCEGI